ncbi:MAG: hypothetical protein J3Q66DRAFT_343793 [Benniella sp.]|nr:MAG: hypothetical protein J3Q66DRAFT_343793 [Benniella sp.]
MGLFSSSSFLLPPVRSHTTPAKRPSTTMFSLEAITPTQRTALVQAWMVYHGVPDYSTLRFISRLTELDLNLVRYWFHCRVNCDGIMHAIANSAPDGDKTIDLPAAEDYHELEKFSSALEEYREQERQQKTCHNHETQAQESCVSSSRHSYKTAPRSRSATSTRAISPAEMSRNIPSKNSQRSAGVRPLITPPGSNGDDVRPKVQRTVRAQKAVAVGTGGTGAQKLSCIHAPAVSQVSLPTDKDQATKQYRGRMRTSKEEMAIESTIRTSEDDVGQTEEDDKSSKKKGGRRPKNQPAIAKRPLILNESDDYEEETDANKKHEIEGRNSFIIKTPPSSGVEDTTVMGSVKKTNLTGRRSADASKAHSSVITDEDENTIVQAEKDATRATGTGKFLKRSDTRESKPFDLSTGIIGDDMDHCQGLINDQVWKVDMIQGHETGTSFKRAQQTKALGRSKSKKVLGSVENADTTHLNQRTGSHDKGRPSNASGPSIGADQETLNPDETRQDDRVLVETSSGQVAGTVAVQERGQRMFLVAVELKERRSERKNDDTEEPASMHGAAAEQLRPAAQKRLPRGQPLLNINKPSMVHASKAEMKQLTTTPAIISLEIPQADDGTGKTRRVVTQLKRQSSAISPTEKKAFAGDQHSMIESGDITLSTAESPDEQSSCEPTTGGSQPATGIISEKMDAMLGKISWRDQFAAIKVKKKPKPPNHHTMGEEVTSHFQSSYNTSPILTHVSVSMPMETSVLGLSSPHGGSSHGYSPFHSMNHEHEHDQIQDYEHSWDHERSRETSRARERSRGHDHDRGRSRDSRDSRRERGQARGRDHHRDRADREHEHSRRHGDRNRDRERQSRSKSHRVDDRGEGRSRMNTRVEDGHGYGERAQGQHDGDWGGWSHTDHFSPVRDRSPSEIQSPHGTRPSRVPSPFEAQSPEVQSPKVQSPEVQSPEVQSPPEIQSPPKPQSPSATRSPPDTEPLPMICISSDVRSSSKVLSVMVNPKRIRKDKVVDTESSKRRMISDTRMTSGTMVDLPDFHPHDYLREELSD